MKALFLGAFNQPGEGALSKKSSRTFVWSSSNFARFAWQLQKRHAARASCSYSSGAGAPCQKTCQSGRWGARACTAVLLLCSLWQCRLSTFIHSKSDISPYRWGYRLEYSQILKQCVSTSKSKVVVDYKSTSLMSCDRCGADNRNKININTRRPPVDLVF